MWVGTFRWPQRNRALGFFKKRRFFPVLFVLLKTTHPYLFSHFAALRSGRPLKFLEPASEPWITPKRFLWHPFEVEIQIFVLPIHELPDKRHSCTQQAYRQL
jgi:hypothetical protein